MCDGRVETLLPIVLLPYNTRALVQFVRGVLHVWARQKTFGGVLAGFVSVDFGSNHDITDRNVLDTSRHADEKRYNWLVVRQGTDGDCCSVCVAGPGFHHSHFPTFEATAKKASAADGLDREFAEMPQHGARFHIERGNNDNSGRRTFWHATGSRDAIGDSR